MNSLFKCLALIFSQTFCYSRFTESKASAWNAGEPGLIPGSGTFPWRRKWQPTPVLLPRKFHGWRSLVGYSPWGCKESDTTEWLHFHFHFMWLLTFLSHFYSMFSSFNVFLFSEGNITFYAGNITFFIFLFFQDLHLAAIATKYIKKVRLIMKLRSRCLLKLLNC